MGIEDVDVVETHPAEALVEAGEQVLARSADAIGAWPHVVAGLGRDDQLVPMAAEVGPEDAARSSPLQTRVAGRSCCRSRSGSRRDRMPAARWRAGCRADGRRRSSATGRGRSPAEGGHSSRPADRPSSRTDPGRHRAAMSWQQAIRRPTSRSRPSTGLRAFALPVSCSTRWHSPPVPPSRSCSPTSRVRRASSARPVRLPGRRSSHATMTCCARRSSATAGSSSRPRATRSSPPSTARPRRWRRPSMRSGRSPPRPGRTTSPSASGWASISARAGCGAPGRMSTTTTSGST